MKKTGDGRFVTLCQHRAGVVCSGLGTSMRSPVPWWRCSWSGAGRVHDDASPGLRPVLPRRSTWRV